MTTVPKLNLLTEGVTGEVPAPVSAAAGGLNENVAGVNLLRAYAGQPGTRSKSKRAAPPHNDSVRHFAGFEMKLSK
jgi:hypothetical protein